MLVFTTKQVNFSNDFWINSNYDFSKYLSHENTGYILISVAFLASHSSMKEAYIKKNWMQALSSIINGARLATLMKQSMLIGGWTRLTIYSRHPTLYLCTSWLFCLSCCHPTTERRTPCIASVGLRKNIYALYECFSEITIWKEQIRKIEKMSLPFSISIVFYIMSW